MIVVPAQLERFNSMKDGSLKISFETNELNPQELLSVAENLNKFGYLAFKPQPFTEVERKNIEGLEMEITEAGKTPSQRLRAVLYRNYEKDKQGFDTFVRYYDHMMEKIINHYKEKLD
jgi:hypothetical protein